MENINNNYPILEGIELLSERRPSIHTFKIVVIGEVGVGKTSFVTKYSYKQKLNNNQITGVKKFYKELGFIKDKSSVINFEIWDSYQQKDDKDTALKYMRDYHIAYVMFALDDISSFKNSKEWLDILNQWKNKRSLIFLIGNKKDRNRQVLNEHIAKIVKECKIDGYFEISCLDEDDSSCKDLLLRSASYVYKEFVIPFYEDKYANRFGNINEKKNNEENQKCCFGINCEFV